MNIAIIGFGVGGAHALKTIIEHANFNDDIKVHIFEKRDELVVGPAYGKDTDYKLLNMEDTYMSLEVGNPDHIYDWFIKNPNLDYRIEGMLPRTSFGEYVKDTYRAYINHPSVTIHKEEVIDIEKIDTAYNITTNTRKYDLNFDAIILSIGQSHYKDSYNLKEEEGFIYNPYPLVEKLEAITGKEKIGIIGTGPTSVDIYRYLRNFKSLDHPLYFLTQQDGFMPVQIPIDLSKDICSIDDRWIDENLDENGSIDLDIVISQIKEDFKNHGVSLNEVYDRYKDTDLESYRKAISENDTDLGFCQIYTMELWAVAARLYNSLNGLGRLKVDKDYYAKLELLIAKTPVLTMDKILHDYDQGKIKIIRGTEEIKKTGNSFLVESKDEPDLEFDIIINAQGFEKNLVRATKEDKLLANLYDRKYIEADRDEDFIRVTYPSYNLINTKYGLMDNIYLSGMWAGSTDFSNNDIRSIVTANENIANDLMGKITK